MKAVILLSGGLDSLLAAKIIKREKFELIGVSFKSYFFDPSNITKKQAGVGAGVVGGYESAGSA